MGITLLNKLLESEQNYNILGSIRKGTYLLFSVCFLHEVIKILSSFLEFFDGLVKIVCNMMRKSQL